MMRIEFEGEITTVEQLSDFVYGDEVAQFEARMFAYLTKSLDAGLKEHMSNPILQEAEAGE